MLDMRDILLLLNHFVDIVVIIALVSAQMLFDSFGIRTFDDNREDKIVRRPHIVCIGRADMNRQWRTALVNQDMDFASTLASIGWIPARFFASKRRWTRFAIDRLPGPSDTALVSIELHHFSQDGFKDTQLSPGLEALMQGTAAHAEPIPVDSLPLATCPHNVPDTIQDRSIISPRSPWLTGFPRFWQQLLDLLPQHIRYFEVIHISRLYVSILVQDVSSLKVILTNRISNEVRPFVQLRLIYG
jgi:hypothetical protein